ncbi:MAG: hypothetical protein KDA74_06300 [Planctomycetaceae bacterium]|nr:hypothetical protein [Planctomycetaceae bacterium]
MMLTAFNLPEETDALQQWLDDLLIKPELTSVVSQLSAVHASNSIEEMSLEQILQEQADAVLQQGCRELSSQQIQQLLTHPERLLELQERLFLEGGTFWQERILAASDDAEVKQSQQWLQNQMETPQSAEEKVEVQQAPAYKTVSYRKIGLLGFVSAALILLAVFLNQEPAPAPGWGWNRPGVLTADIPAPEYLNKLADSAEEWFNKPTDTKAALETRLKQFRAGCETLINAPHPQLSATDRAWLVERCQVWAGKLDAQIVALNQGADLKTADAEADALIRKLVDALRNRATTVS